MSSKESLYRRPYKSRRRREAAKLTSEKKDGRTLLRILAVLFLTLIVALTLIFKDVGKSQMATGKAMTGGQ